MKVDPRSLFATEPLQFSDIAVGDVIASSNWSRGRVVVNQDENNNGKVFYLADPDETYAEGPRRLDQAAFNERGQWRRYEALSAIWKKAIGVKVEAGSGGFKFL
jgi:hypothetical protein